MAYASLKECVDDLTLRVRELVQSDDAFALAADVDDDFVTMNGDDCALDDFAFFDETAPRNALLEKVREATFSSGHVGH